MIDWNVNEIKRRISRREISPLVPLHTRPYPRGWLKFVEGVQHGHRWTGPRMRSQRAPSLPSTWQQTVNHAIWRGVTSNADLQWGGKLSAFSPEVDEKLFAIFSPQQLSLSARVVSLEIYEITTLCEKRDSERADDVIINITITCKRNRKRNC